MAKILPLDQLSPTRFDTPAILKKLALASRQLAELKGVAASIPRQSILISTLGMQEAKDSSAIENIVTTHDDLFRNAACPEPADSLRRNGNRQTHPRRHDGPRPALRAAVYRVASRRFGWLVPRCGRRSDCRDSFGYQSARSGVSPLLPNSDFADKSSSVRGFATLPLMTLG